MDEEVFYASEDSELSIYTLSVHKVGIPNNYFHSALLLMTTRFTSNIVEISNNHFPGVIKRIPTGTPIDLLEFNTKLFKNNLVMILNSLIDGVLETNERIMDVVFASGVKVVIGNKEFIYDVDDLLKVVEISRLDSVEKDNAFNKLKSNIKHNQRVLIEHGYISRIGIEPPKIKTISTKS